MQIANIKKATLESGAEWVEPRPWKQNLPEYRVSKTFKKTKGHKWEKEKEDREKLIKQNLLKMPQWIAAYRKDERERKKKTTTADKLIWPSKMRRLVFKKKKKKRISEHEMEAAAEKAQYRLEREVSDNHSIR